MDEHERAEWRRKQFSHLGRTFFVMDLLFWAALIVIGLLFVWSVFTTGCKILELFVGPICR